MGLSAAERRALLEALGSDDPQERAYGAFELGEARARSARPSIEALLEDAVPLVRGAAAYALWRLAGQSGAASAGADPGAPAVQALVPLLSSRDEETCQLAVHALGRMGAAAIPGLERAARSRSRHRGVARRVLAEIQGEAEG